MRLLLVPHDLCQGSVTDAAMLKGQLEAEYNHNPHNTGNRLEIDIAHTASDNKNLRAPRNNYDLAVALGGDGTLLRAAHLIEGTDAALFGISYGHLGFLSAGKATEGFDLIKRALNNKLYPSQRCLLAVTAHFVDGESTQFFCLNDVALKQGSDCSIVRFSIAVSSAGEAGEPSHSSASSTSFASSVPVDETRKEASQHTSGCAVKLADLAADGCVIATATGSSGYALSAGGPLVHPEYEGMICVPVAPHTLNARAYVTGPHEAITVTLHETSQTKCVLTCDGRTIAALSGIRSFTASPSDKKVTLLTQEKQAFSRAIARVFYGGHE